MVCTLVLLTNLSQPLANLLTGSRGLGAVVGFLSVAVIMGLQLWIIYEESALRPSIANALKAAALLGVLGFLMPRLASRLFGSAVYALVLSPWRNLFLLLAAVSIGLVVARAMKDAAMLMPAVVVAAMVDFWGVYFGSTLYFVTTSPKLVQGVSVFVPTVANVVPSSLIGPGDFVFLGVFAASLHHFRLQVRKTFVAFFVLLTLSLVLLQIAPEQWNLSIPGLVPMAIAVLWVNGRRVKLSRGEAYATGYAVAGVAALLVFITWMGAFALSTAKHGHGATESPVPQTQPTK
jgi:hypothetical protein